MEHNRFTSEGTANGKKNIETRGEVIFPSQVDLQQLGELIFNRKGSGIWLKAAEEEKRIGNLQPVIRNKTW